MAVTGVLTPDPRLRELTSLGVVAPGAKLLTQLSGSTTNTPVYTTAAMNVAHANPVIASSSGLFPAIYLNPALTYRYTLKDEFDNVIWGPQDGISTTSPGSLSYTVSNAAGTPLTAAVPWTVQGKLDTFVSIKDFGATGDGTTNDAPALVLAYTAVSAAGGSVLFPVGTYRISTNTTVPASVTLWFEAGAKLSIDTGVTVFVYGPVQAPSTQIFSGAGVVRFTNGATHPYIVSPTTEYQVMWWGAKFDNATNDAAVFQKALDAVPVSGTLRLPIGISKIGTALTFLGGINIRGSGRTYTRLMYTGTGGALLTLSQGGYLFTVLSDFCLENQGTAAVGFDVYWTFVVLERMMIGPFDNASSGVTPATTGFSAAGVRFNSISGGYTTSNTIQSCYIFENAVGIDFVLTNSTIVIGCHINNNVIDARVQAGTAITFEGNSFLGDYTINGAGFIGIDVQNANNVVIRDCEFETDLSQTGVAAASSLAVRIGNVATSTSTTIAGNWFNGCGSSDVLVKVMTTANVESLNLRDNTFYRANAAIAVPTGGLAKMEIGVNRLLSTTALLRVNGVDDANSYAYYLGRTGVARWDGSLLIGSAQAANVAPGEVSLAYNKALRSANPGASNTLEIIKRGSLNSTEGIVIGGSGDITQFGGLVAHSYEAPTYGASVVLSGLANIHKITATNGTAFTVNNPGSTVVGALTIVTISNTSGGALGAITWGAAFNLAGAFTAPATTFNRSVLFYWDGARHQEISRSAADVPN